MSVKTFLIYGGKGWIGSQLQSLILQSGHNAVFGQSRVENYADILREIRGVKPDYVLHTAGKTGVPNVDWCEDNKEITYFTNIVGTVNLAQACLECHLNLTYYASGCIYTYPRDSDGNMMYCKFTEEDSPNFRGSTYSKSRIIAEEALKVYPNVLILRLRMPITNSLEPKNLITKLLKYEKVVNIPNSITILPELLPISLELTQDGITGVYNFCNVGAVSHNEILGAYRDIVDSNYVWKNFTVFEQAQVIKADRSNCELDVSKLEVYCRNKGLKLSLAKDGLHQVMMEIRNSSKKS